VKILKCLKPPPSFFLVDFQHKPKLVTFTKNPVPLTALFDEDFPNFPFWVGYVSVPWRGHPVDHPDQPSTINPVLDLITNHAKESDRLPLAKKRWFTMDESNI